MHATQLHEDESTLPPRTGGDLLQHEERHPEGAEGEHSQVDGDVVGAEVVLMPIPATHQHQQALESEETTPPRNFLQGDD